MKALAATLLVGSVALAGCGAGKDDAAPRTGSSTAPDAPRVVATIAKDLEAPWGLAFLPDKTALVTERDSGDVLHVTAPGKVDKVGTVDETSAGGESGLLGIAVSPSYDGNRQVYLYVSSDDDNRILRATFDGTSLTDPEPILTGIPRGQIHDGGRLAFGPDGYLYASTGETGDRDLAQDTASLGGKILRITEDGKPAPGNPDPDSPVWTLGHRNVQGLAFDPDGRLWASEFGQDTYDELNLVEKGKNYGWPEVEGKGGKDGLTDPQITWSTDDASPSGLAYLDGHLWMGALHGARLWRVDLDGAKATDPLGYFVGDYGRIRTVVAAPDGTLWVTTSNTDGRGEPASDDDRILQVDPG